MKIKTTVYNSFEQFEQDNCAMDYEHMTVVNENGWIKADLLTECKNWKTALRRFFNAHPDQRVVDDWRECMIESAENGYFKDNDSTLASGEHNPFFSYAYEIEQLDDSLFYVFLNVSEKRYT